MKKVYLIFIFVFFMFVFNSRICALEEGIYTIHSAIDYSYVIDIEAAKKSNGTNIQLYKLNRTNAQKFYITKNNDTYIINSMIDNNYVIDLLGGNHNNNINIQLYEINNTEAQKWMLKDYGAGYYGICTPNDDYCIDVNMAQASNGTNIQLYKSNGTSAQKFYFERYYEPSKTIEDGVYSISSAISSNLVFDINMAKISNGTNIQNFSTNNTEAQKWYVKYLDDGYYSISAYLNVNYVMDVEAASINLGANVQLYHGNNTSAQKWIIKDTGDGYYNIISKCNNLAIDIAGASPKSGTNIWMYNYNNTNAQKFKFNKVINEAGSKAIKDGTYIINLSSNYYKVLDIEAANVIQNTNIQLYDLNYSLAQKWDIKYLSDGRYAIFSNKDNNYALSYDNETKKIRIEKYQSLSNQKWIIKKVDKAYYILNDADLYINFLNNSITNGNNSIVSKFNGNSFQRFTFTKTASGISDKVINDGIYIVSSSLDSNKVLDVSGASKTNGTNIQLYSSNGTVAQKWRIKYMYNGYYMISSLVDLNKGLDVASNSTISGTNVQLYDNNISMAQQWLIKDVGGGYYSIISNNSGLYLDVAGASTSNGTNIWMYEGNQSKAQKFKFIPTMEDTKVIDVSAHQGKIDWNKVYNTGIYGVILRIGTWETLDSRFYSYLDEVERLGLPYGIYLYSYASTTNGANIEANFTKKVINGTLKGHEGRKLNPTLGIYYDIEDWYISDTNTSNILSKNDYDNIISTYINNVASGISSKYKVKVYANSNYALNRFNDYARSQVDWLADYRGYKGYKGPISLWQYTSSATLNGINGYVDMSYLQ